MAPGFPKGAIQREEPGKSPKLTPRSRLSSYSVRASRQPQGRLASCLTTSPPPLVPQMSEASRSCLTSAQKLPASRVLSAMVGPTLRFSHFLCSSCYNATPSLTLTLEASNSASLGRSDSGAEAGAAAGAAAGAGAALGAAALASSFLGSGFLGAIGAVSTER